MKDGSHQLRRENSIAGWPSLGLTAGKGLKMGRISVIFKEGVSNLSLVRSHLLEHLFPALRLTERDEEPAG